MDSYCEIHDKSPRPHLPPLPRASEPQFPFIGLPDNVPKDFREGLELHQSVL